ncbi:MAG: ATP-dependent sacrificial sulfur transferase LarE [Chloroflexi bacterium]|nr:ATP-dependent sacrificial sulfur transferase LarE [Chloroflexota bacterium]
MVVETTLEQKLARLQEIVREMGSCVVAYSGGVDSTFLLKVAHDVLGDRVLGVTALSETYPAEELEEAVALARQMGARHMVLETQELENEAFASNPPTRCYFCKSELFSKLQGIAEKEGLQYVVDGFNVDDLGDFRPGMQAGQEKGVRSPLREAGMGKADIRALSQQMGLPTWDKPALACLSSRIPYGHRISREKLGQIGAAERFLREIGFRQLRVRHHDAIARIEVAPEEMPALLANADGIVTRLKQLGFLYVTMDLQGYRTGSMNEALAVGKEAAPKQE